MERSIDEQLASGSPVVAILGHPKAVVYLSQRLKHVENKTVTTLVLKMSVSTDEAAIAITELLHSNSTITHIDMGMSFFTESNTERIAGALKFNNTLTRLSFEECEMDDDVLLPIAQALKVNTGITFLDLSENQFSDVGISYISETFATQQYSHAP
jgi:Leucine Rich repeat